MPSKIEVKNDIDEKEFFQELGLQGIQFHEAVGEIIDNAISASVSNEEYLDEDNPDEDFHIRVTLEKQEGEDLVDVVIADAGEGMDKSTVKDHLFRPGHKDPSSGDGLLNEHGMGLKHSISALDRDGGAGFTILTKTEDMELDEIIKAEGPLSNPSAQKGDFEDEWKENAGAIETSDSGTRVHITVPFAQVKDSYPMADKLDSIMDGFHEHLGVMYHNFIDHTSRNRIILSWEDPDNNDSGEVEVSPIYPVYKDGTDSDGKSWSQTDTIEISSNGDTYDVEYERGIIDWTETEDKYSKSRYDYSVNSSSGTESPFRIYYRNNQQTQGVNIVYRGRILETSILTDIWGEARHNRYNRFAGEIRLRDEAFETLFNKTNINMDSELWREVKDELQSKEDYQPREWGEEQQEDSLQSQLKEHLKNERNCTDVTREKDAGCDLDVDLLQEFEDDQGDESVIIHEVKRSKARPQDVYQCVMYWDSYKHHKSTELEKVVLVSGGISNNASEILDIATNRTDVNGEDYEIEQKNLDDYPGIEL